MPDLRRLLRNYPQVRRALSPVLSARQFVLGGKRREAQAVTDRIAGALRTEPLVSVPEFSGDFYLSPTSHLFSRIVMEGHYEPGLVRAILPLLDKAKDAIDVGANAGFYSVLLAQELPGCRVLAVEPTRAAVDRLKRNLQVNDLSTEVIVFEGAVGAEAGELTMNVIDGMEEYASTDELVHVAVQSHAGRATSETVAVERLDDLVVKYGLKPGFIKIDVEGAELDVLEGALEALRIHRPVILCEVSEELLRLRNRSARELVHVVESAGYRVFDPGTGEVPRSALELDNALCIPTEPPPTG